MMDETRPLALQAPTSNERTVLHVLYGMHTVAWLSLGMLAVIALNLTVFVLIALACHGEAYRRRPEAGRTGCHESNQGPYRRRLRLRHHHARSRPRAGTRCNRAGFRRLLLVTHAASVP